MCPNTKYTKLTPRATQWLWVVITLCAVGVIVIVVCVLLYLHKVTYDDTTVCLSDQTPCASYFSANGKGCCTMANAVCCPNSQTCCPNGTTCYDTGPYTTTCVSSDSNTTGLSVCKPGPGIPMSTNLPNCLIMGDSVSIGYTPYVIQHLSSICNIQHSPYDTSDGGVEETAYGIQCLPNFLHDVNGAFIGNQMDIVMFNWGLHNIGEPGQGIPGQYGDHLVYDSELEIIVQRLLSLAPQAKFLFAITTPVPFNSTQNQYVLDHNRNATALMAKYGIPVLDMYTAVIIECGQPPYTECYISLNTPQFNSVHYTALGYEYLAQQWIAPAIQSMLK